MPPSSRPADGDATYLEGVVTRSTGQWSDVQVDDRVIPSRIRGKFRLSEQKTTNPVAVGDWVTLRLNEEDQTGLITEIHNRTNKLSRRAAGPRTGEEHVMVANVDRIWIVQAVRRPTYNARFVDRLLVAAAAHGIPAGLIINKIDLMQPDDRAAVMNLHLRYADLEYPVVTTSATEGTGIDRLQQAFDDQINALTGPSGSGKSTILNTLEPDLDLDTTPVNPKTQTGPHTTTHAELHPLSTGGYVVDTPGVREFGVHAVPPVELAHYFPEFRPYINECEFSDCTHDHEPGCAVQRAVEASEIHPDRYESYLHILTSLQDEHAPDY